MEITKGSKVKYELDKKTGLIKVFTNPFEVSMKFQEIFEAFDIGEFQEMM